MGYRLEGLGVRGGWGRGLGGLGLRGGRRDGDHEGRGGLEVSGADWSPSAWRATGMVLWCWVGVGARGVAHFAHGERKKWNRRELALGVERVGKRLCERAI